MNISSDLKAYIPLADMISSSFGDICEVVIHDLKDPQNSVVYVSNGNITNRKVGQSFDYLIKDVLLSKDFKNDYKSNYIFRLQNGKRIKSSTSIIRDINEDVIGAFCINIEIEHFLRMKSFLDTFFKEEKEEENNRKENDINSFDNVSQIIDSLIDNIIGNKDLSRMNRTDKISLLTFMYDKGIFQMKGSIDKVAVKLDSSPVTIYSYLDEIKKCSN